MIDEGDTVGKEEGERGKRRDEEDEEGEENGYE